MLTNYPFLTNGAGEEFKDEEQIEEFLRRNPSKGVVPGSITIEDRKGNPEPNFVPLEEIKGSQNRIGLRNKGKDHFKEMLPRIRKRFESIEELKGFVMIPSLAYARVKNDHCGIKAEELNNDPSLQYEILVRELGMFPYELNVSCPHEGNRLLYEDLKLIGEILEKVEKQVGEGNYNVKTGYMLPGHMTDFVNVVSHYNPYAIVATNTILGLVPDGKGGHHLHPESKGIGGIGGRPIEYFALYVARSLRDELNNIGRKDTKLIGSGGIYDEFDARDFMVLGGADHLQMWTGYIQNKHNPSYLTQLLIRLAKLLEEKHPELLPKLGPIY